MILALLFVVTTGSASAANEKVDLYLLVDGSGSISSSDFELQLEGMANTINNSSIVPQDGSVSISVIQFSNIAQVEIPLTTINSQSDADNISSDIIAINQVGGSTNISGAINLSVQKLPDDLSGKQIIDLSTDGVPNVNGIQASYDARDNANNSGFEELNTLGVGIGVNETFLKELVFPQPSDEYPGFYTFAGDFDTFQKEFEKKAGKEVGQKPIKLEKYTNGKDSDTKPGQQILVGETVTWSYNVTNQGDKNLTNVTIKDDVTGFTHDCGKLVPGEWCNVTYSSTAEKGQYENIGNATGQYNDTNYSDQDSSYYFGANPSIDMEKYTNGMNASSPTGPEILENDTVTWSYNVTNNGNVNLTDVIIKDDETGFTHYCGKLEPGEWCNVTNSSKAEKGQYENEGIATGDYNGLSIEGYDSSYYFGADPSIDIEMYTMGEDADEPQGPAVQVGNEVTWTYEITNTGNVNLTEINITKNGSIEKTYPNINLEPGESFTYSTTGVSKLGQQNYNGNVTAVYENEMYDEKIQVNASDPSHYLGFDHWAGVPTANPVLLVGVLGIAVLLFLKREQK
ncbi:von Willebrand factor type A (plasmid) [Methanohalobium evestigatum Z-7303]|uniref:von Willebrand factor type A n=1 Tax=Methanohalobium evestigatum (strain ATCC BAA-1072 / DSM 3721 / NBRC 107634 / OCM 161 / Z-7303) TaxID=644295 RepID=D7EBW4_METEZ|nr:DUF1194 domain-containing protein [Methanohalobium evestigatum]ADI75086.1 von Willebrand factor type A [Methanohalobium evestigatum Z-7303]